MVVPYIAYDIDWDIDPDNAVWYLMRMPESKAAEILDIYVDDWAAMDEDEREDFALDFFCENPDSMMDVVDLPVEVELPIEAGSDEDSIIDWLSDTYGFLINGLKFSSVSGY